jgi:hypothetical protein
VLTAVDYRKTVIVETIVTEIVTETVTEIVTVIDGMAGVIAIGIGIGIGIVIGNDVTTVVVQWSRSATAGSVSGERERRSVLESVTVGRGAHHPLGLSLHLQGMQHHLLGMPHRPSGMQRHPLDMLHHLLDMQHHLLGMQHHPLGMRLHPLGTRLHPLGMQLHPLDTRHPLVQDTRVATHLRRIRMDVQATQMDGDNAEHFVTFTAIASTTGHDE